MKHFKNKEKLAELMAVFEAQYIGNVTNQAVDRTWSSDECLQYINNMEKAYSSCLRLYGRYNTLFAFMERYAPFIENFIPAETKAASDLMDAAFISYQEITHDDNCPFSDYEEKVYDIQMQQMNGNAPAWYVMEVYEEGLIDIEKYHKASDHIIDEQSRAVRAIAGLEKWHADFLPTQEAGHRYQQIEIPTKKYIGKNEVTVW